MNLQAIEPWLLPDFTPVAARKDEHDELPLQKIESAELEDVKPLPLPAKYPNWLMVGAATALFVCLIGLVTLVYALIVNSLNLAIASMFIMAASFAGVSLALRVGEGIRDSGKLQQ